MKKIIPAILTVSIMTASFTGCASNTPSASAPSQAAAAAPSQAPAAATLPAPVAAPEANESSIKTGLGIVTSIGKSKNAAADANGTAQVDSVIAAVTVDDSGKITKVVIDTAQTRIAFDAKGEISTDLTAPVLSKLEKGDDYGMKPASQIGKEWYEQITAFAEWTLGKTIDEVKALNVKKVDDAHTAVPDVPELVSSVTITVGDYITAMEKAVSADSPSVAVSGDVKTGLGVVTGIGKSKNAAADANGTAQVDSIIAAVTIDDAGKVIACDIDTAQTRVAFNAAGEISTDLTALVPSKTELGDAYGMLGASQIGKEWYQQMAAFEEWTIGKTIDEIKGLNVKVVNDAHQNVPDDPELSSSVTITVEDYIAAIEKAIASAK